MEFTELKEFLEEKYDLYNRPNFIESDPIQIPHKFSRKEDIEISAFLTAQIAWGKRSMIIRNAQNIVNIMQNNPYEFIMNASETDFDKAFGGGHRTFKGEDLRFFLESLQNIYVNKGGLESVFYEGFLQENSVFSAVRHFREVFFDLEHLKRTEKHVADVVRGSAAKRINMFLMWLVRNDKRGVHFGIWKKIPTSALKMPLDVHSGNTARSLGLLKRKYNDLQAVDELTSNLSEFDKNDPVKYDFALFGAGVFEGFGRE